MEPLGGIKVEVVSRDLKNYFKSPIENYNLKGFVLPSIEERASL